MVVSVAAQTYKNGRKWGRLQDLQIQPHFSTLISDFLCDYYLKHLGRTLQRCTLPDTTHILVSMIHAVMKQESSTVCYAVSEFN